MVSWIESHSVLVRHRKVLETATALKTKPVHLLGHLHALWHAAIEQQEDGDLQNWSDSYIAAVAQWEGDPTEFVAQLQKFHWLDGKLIHDWLDYAGRYLKRKYYTHRPDLLRKIYSKHNRKLSVTKVSPQRHHNDTMVSPRRHESVTLVNPPTYLPKERKKDRKENMPLDQKQELKKGSFFLPPTIEEVKEYAKLVGLRVDASEFFDFYAAKNWVFGNSPMRDWQAALRSWFRNGSKIGRKNDDKDASWLYEKRKKEGRCTTCGTTLIIRNGLKICSKCDTPPNDPGVPKVSLKQI